MLKEVEFVMARTIADRLYEATGPDRKHSEYFYQNVIFGMQEMVLNILYYQGYSIEDAGEKLTEIHQTAENLAAKRKEREKRCKGKR